jgi:sugar lactone lactonase YvrE
MRRGGLHTGLTWLLAALVVAACNEGGGVSAESNGPAADSSSQSGSSSPDSAPEGSTNTDTPPSDCAIAPGQPWADEVAVDVEEIGEVEGATIDAAVYPHPDYEGKPWSQWGQGIVTDDGRFFSAIGDHIGPDGNSYVYEYDPKSDHLTMVGDVLSYVDHVPGTWGYGKIHSQMVFGPCEEIYFSTYWGTSRDLEFEGNYTGDLIFRLDPYGRTLQPLGVPVAFHGQASMASDPTTGLVYGEARDPIRRAGGGRTGPFFAYDVSTEETIFVSDIRSDVGYRSILVDEEGVAYWSIGRGELQSYDPATGDSDTHHATLPGDWLRAVTEPAPSGHVYGVTRDPDTFFAMDPLGGISGLGDALGYTASMALSPDGSSFFYMPGAHGNSAEWDSPLISVDTVTGEQTVIVELEDLVMSELGYAVGGTYNVAVSPDGERVFMGVNAGIDGESFGEVILLVIDLP